MAQTALRTNFTLKSLNLYLLKFQNVKIKAFTFRFRSYNTSSVLESLSTSLSYYWPAV